MMKTRRGFVRALTAAGVLAAGGVMVLAQIHPTYPKPPAPGDPQERDKNADPTSPQTLNRVAMLKNEK
jgi:hypothetical protein